MYTVKELYDACKRQVENGNGDKKIILACDTEGNRVRRLDFLFTDETWEFASPEDVHLSEEEFKNCILLG